MIFNNTPRRYRGSLLISSANRPGWHTELGRVPQVGEKVQCMEGEAEVVRICGRVGDGSRLLELRLYERPKTPYFAASSNVLLQGEGDPSQEAAGPVSAQPIRPLL